MSSKEIMVKSTKIPQQIFTASFLIATHILSLSQITTNS